MHGGWSTEAETSREVKLEKATTLSAGMKRFKAEAKLLKRKCVGEDDEKYLDTSYARANRLRPLAITNKHTMLRGRPCIEEADASTISKAILAMKGIHQRKHRAAHEEGRLMLRPKRLSYQGSTHAWARNISINDFEDWTRGEHEQEVQHVHKTNLESIVCPCCKRTQTRSKLKLKTYGTFSQLKRVSCNTVSSTALWRCQCNIPWFKCGMHVQMNSMYAPTSGVRVHRKRKICNEGVDEPMPKVRRIGEAVGDITAESAIIKLIPLQPGICPLLSNRFPHLTRSEGRVTTPCPDGCPDQRG
jgi:hypothetical protein